jgi:hypothetical protein
MKAFATEPRLQILNERLTARITRDDRLGKPMINFVNQDTIDYGDISIKIKPPVISPKIMKAKNEVTPPRRTRMQRSIRVVIRSKSGKTGMQREFYPDIVEIEPPVIVTSRPESTLLSCSEHHFS